MNLLNLLAPPSCPFCGTALYADETGVCRPCFRDLPWTEARVAPIPGIFATRISLLDYAFPVDAAIKAFKFKRRLYYAPAFAAVLNSASDLLPGSIDAVTSVPLHWRRKAFRGFNQATEIARPLARGLGVPFARCLRRRKATPFQSGLDARERAQNLREAFIVRQVGSYAHVLLVDDVMTTGATAMAAARCLLSAGVESVSVITLAKASG